MLYSLIALVILLLGAFVAYKAVRILLQGSWLAGWFRGMFGLCLLAVGLVIGLMAFDVYRYKQILHEQVVATISLEKNGEQQFTAILVDSKGNEQKFNLRGDQWQLDARIFKTKGYLSTFGLRPAYRLERISGRYYDLAQEHAGPRTAYALNESLYGVDVWKWINQYPRWMPVVDAVYGSATFLPMADRALYEITLSHTGLLARPLNREAEEAVSAWK